jgi:hypothetical protein
MRATLGFLSMVTTHAAVSFATVPLSEISAKAAEIKAAGWIGHGRGDPWVQTFSKSLPDTVNDPEAELRRIMGDYWLDADGIRELLYSR